MRYQGGVTVHSCDPGISVSLENLSVYSTRVPTIFFTVALCTSGYPASVDDEFVVGFCVMSFVARVLLGLDDAVLPGLTLWITLLVDGLLTSLAFLDISLRPSDRLV